MAKAAFADRPAGFFLVLSLHLSGQGLRPLPSGKNGPHFGSGHGLLVLGEVVRSRILDGQSWGGSAVPAETRGAMEPPWGLVWTCCPACPCWVPFPCGISDPCSLGHDPAFEWQECRGVRPWHREAGGEAEAGPLLRRPPPLHAHSAPTPRPPPRGRQWGDSGDRRRPQVEGAPVPSSFLRNRQVHRAAFRDPLATGSSLRLYFFWPRLE